MARLPSDAEIGLPNAQSGRPIASIDQSGYARGAAAQAQGAQNLGEGISRAGQQIGYAVNRQQEQDDKLELARATADWRIGKVGLDTKYKDDPDYPTIPKRYDEEINALSKSASERIRSPRAKELFTLSVADDLARGRAVMGEHANTKWRDHTLADAQTKLDGLGQGFLLSADPVERTKMIDDGNNLIDALVDKNIITRTEAATRKKAWAENQAVALIDNLPPEDKVRALGGFTGALKKSESGGDPTKVNQLGYAGLYQFGAPRLAAMGIYQPGSKEDLAGWSKTGRAAPEKWSGMFNIPGHPDVRNINDFLRSPAAQETAFKIHSQKMDQEIKDNGFEKYIGETVGGVKITREGLHAMMHLGGVGGARDALTGKANARDANGTSVLDYAAKLGAQNDYTRVASLIPESKRIDMEHKGQLQIKAQSLEETRLAAEQKRKAQQLSDDAEGEILKQLHSSGSSVSANSIVNDDRLLVNAKERMVRLLEHVGKADRTEATYGKEFYSLFQRVHAPEGDPRRITDPAVLYEHVRPGGGLTLGGMEKLRAEMSGKRTPEGEAEGALKKQFFANAKGQISGSNDGLGIKDPKGDELYLKFMAQALAEYDKGRKDGKSASALLNPESSDYIGKSVASFKRPMSQWFADTIQDAPATQPVGFDPAKVSTLDDLVNAHRSGKVSALEARAIAVDRGWAKARPASAVTPSVPMSQ
jgi:hypothetical protein